MKIFKILISTAVLLVAVIACRDESLEPIPYSNPGEGAYVRTVKVNSGVHNLTTPASAGSAFSIEVELVGVGDAGEKMQSLTLFAKQTRGASFTIITAEQQVKVYTAADLVTSHSGTIPNPDITSYKYPRMTMTVTTQELLTALGNPTLVNLDNIEYRVALTLTSGFTFSNVNASGDVLTGAYYLSPFFYRIPAVNFTVTGTGAYMLSTTSPNFGAIVPPATTTSQPVTLSAGAFDVQRTFTVNYRGLTNVPIAINLENGRVQVPLQSTPFSCTNATGTSTLSVWLRTSTSNTYQNSNAVGSTMSVRFNDDWYNKCNFLANTVLTLTKQ